LAGGSGFWRRPGTRTKLAVFVLVVTVVSVFVYLQFAEPYGNNALAMDWRMKLTFSDYRPTGANYSLPSGIGAPGGIHSGNHTLDSLGPPGYAPLSTRDGSSTIWVQSNQITIFTFGDFFNIWGQTFNKACVSFPYVQIGSVPGQPYCTAPAEAIVYSPNDDLRYDPTAGDKLLPVVTQGSAHTPSTGAPLSYDPKLKFYDDNGNGIYDVSDTLVYDNLGNGLYDPTYDTIASVTNQSLVPRPGAPLRTDLRIRFFDFNNNGRWDPFVPPPILFDVGRDQIRCLDRNIGLSNGKTWILYLWYPFQATSAEIQGGCLPPGF
jgi:hypothetical protein